MNRDEFLFHAYTALLCFAAILGCGLVGLLITKVMP